VTQARAIDVWQRIVAQAGETFTQIRGAEFTYDVQGDYLHLDRTNQAISRKHIEQALELVPLASTVPVRHLRAPSYVYVIVIDSRTRQHDW